MSNIYLKVTIEKNWSSQNFDFLSLQILSPGPSLRSSNSRWYHDIIEFSNFFLQLKNYVCKLFVKSRSKTMRGFSIFLWRFMSYDVLKSKSPCILLNKKIKFDKNETESKMGNITQL